MLEVRTDPGRAAKVERAQAFSAVAAAQQKVDQITWNLNYLLSTPDTLEVGQADAEIAVATAAQAAKQQALDAIDLGKA